MLQLEVPLDRAEINTLTDAAKATCHLYKIQVGTDERSPRKADSLIRMATYKDLLAISARPFQGFGRQYSPPYSFMGIDKHFLVSALRTGG